MKKLANTVVAEASAEDKDQQQQQQQQHQGQEQKLQRVDERQTGESRIEFFSRCVEILLLMILLVFQKCSTCTCFQVYFKENLYA